VLTPLVPFLSAYAVPWVACPGVPPCAACMLAVTVSVSLRDGRSRAAGADRKFEGLQMFEVRKEQPVPEPAQGPT